MSILLPDYTALERQLSVAGAAIAPSELHGVLCGLLCVAGREAATQWLGEQLESFIGHERDVDAVCLTLEELELASWSALSGSELQFNPVLPDEDVDLAERTTALGQWCLGFIGGLALGGWNDLDVGEYSDEVNEIVRDFSAISNAGIGETEKADFESAEFSFAELAEYVRIGAQFVFETMIDADDAQPPPTIH